MQKYYTNNQIRAEIVRVIGPDGKYLGVLKIADAIQKAKDANLDLVEMNPNANPPVCKILDLGKFLYKQSKDKKKQEAHQKRQKMKTIKIGITTGDHDLKLKSDHVIEFLNKGDRVRVELVLRGRQKKHVDFAREKMDKFIKYIAEYIDDDFSIKKTPSGFSTDLKLSDDLNNKAKKAIKS